MPREAERTKRRAMGLCVECPTPSKAARCPVCKDRERRRAQRVAWYARHRRNKRGRK